MGGITKNAQVHVAAALAASTQVDDSGSGSVPSCLFLTISTFSDQASI